MLLNPLGGVAFFIGLIGSSPPAFWPKLREEGAEGEVFLGWDAVSYDLPRLLICRWSFGVVSIGDTEAVMKESIDMKGVKPPLCSD